MGKSVLFAPALAAAAAAAGLAATPTPAPVTALAAAQGRVAYATAWTKSRCERVVLGRSSIVVKTL